MKTGYLTWIKDLDTHLHGRRDCYDFTSSAIYPPDILPYLARPELPGRLREADAWGHPGLVRAIGNRYGVLAPGGRVDAARILLTNGASLGIWLVCRALLQPGDHVVVESPVYEPLLAAPDSLGARISWLPRTADGQIDPRMLLDALTPQTTLIMLSNLHNPSGALLSEAALLEIARIARSVNTAVKILVDETFHDFAGDRSRPAALLDPCFITINTLSKVYGLSVLRCGWVLATAPLVARVRDVYVLVENIGSGLTESLASLVLDDLDRAAFAHQQRALVARRRGLVGAALARLQRAGHIRLVLPEYGCICFPAVTGIADITPFVQDLAATQGVYLVPGVFFGAPAHVRIGFGGPYDDAHLQAGLDRLATALAAWPTSNE